MPDLLYSCNPLMKLTLQERFYGDLHYVWCAEQWDSQTNGKYSFRSLVPPSSNPCDIYRSLKDAIARADRHNDHIGRWKSGYLARAAEQVQNDQMTEEDQAELAYMLDTPDFSMWRPLVYIIPKALVQDRIALVRPDNRAGLGLEYTIAGLRRSEFDLLEF